MSSIENIYQFILEINKLKQIFRTTNTFPDRKESTAEHSWSATMIIVILMHDLKNEFHDIDELRTVKLALIHDLVEIYAGDVIAFDIEARKDKEKLEIAALEKLVAIYPKFGEILKALWHEFEKKESIEAKIAKAADAICPIFQRLQSKQSYIPFEITVKRLEEIKYPYFVFSKTFSMLFLKLKQDLLKEKLIVRDF